MYKVNITWNNQPIPISPFEVIPEAENDFRNVIELPDEFLTALSIEWLNFYKPSNFVDLKDEILEPEELRRKYEELRKKCTYLESLQRGLNQKISDLSLSNLCNERDNLKNENKYLKNQLEETKKEVERKNRNISDLSQYKLFNQLLTDANSSLRKDIEMYQQNYDILFRESQNLILEYNKLQEQAAKLPVLQRENERLQKSKKALEDQINLIEEELEKNRRKLDLATTRLSKQTVTLGIIRDGSQWDKLKNKFDNLKKGLFYDASSKVLNCWRAKDNTITFRSEEFSKIKSILSQRVFADGMYYFADNKSEVSTNVDLIINELVLIEELTLSISVVQAIQHKIESVLLRTKGVDHFDETLIKYVETTTQNILQDLQQIRNFYLDEGVQKEIKNFVEAGLKLVLEVVNDSSSGEFYMPEIGAEFDENLHDTRDEPEGKVKLTICPGYRIPGIVLVKADVLTYVSNIQTTLHVSDIKDTSTPETSFNTDGDITNKTNQHGLSVNQDQQYKPTINLEESDGD